jgi:acetyl-CoA acetyltransferase
MRGRPLQTLDSMEATGLTVLDRVASQVIKGDACALVTGGQSCTSQVSMLI